MISFGSRQDRIYFANSLVVARQRVNGFAPSIVISTGRINFNKALSSWREGSRFQLTGEPRVGGWEVLWRNAVDLAGISAARACACP